MSKEGGNNYWKILSILFFVIFIIVLFCSIYYFLKSEKKLDKASINIIENNFHSKKSIKDKENKCSDCKRRLIDGVYTKNNYNPYPFAVVLDNSIAARPTYGLSQAKLVYEVEVEGGITRYLAIFDIDSNFKEIGPIRSARPYFVDWTNGLSSTLVHCGGSPSALASIIKDDVNDMNEFYNGSYFKRDNSRKAPHNVFISKTSLEKYAKKNNLTQSKILSFKFKKDGKANKDLGYHGIKVDYKDGYNVKWEYNPSDNNYLRFLNNKKHFDAENRRIKAKNIIVQFVKTKVIDEKLRLKIDTIGKGNSVICLDGKCENGQWKKENKKTRTRYYIDNKEVAFNAGITWIEVVRDTYKDKVLY